MGFGSMAIDDWNRDDGEREGIAKLLTILKDYSLEELLTCQDDRLRLVAEFLVERAKKDCDDDRLGELITQFDEMWKQISENPFSKLDGLPHRVSKQKSNSSMPTL